MFGEVGSGRRARVLRRRLPQLYSQHVTSRIHSNSLKTNDGRHVYSSQTRGDDFRAFGPLRGEKIPFVLFRPA
jgi:hypothetical protein